MKKIIALLLIMLLIVISMVSCKRKEQPENNTAEAQQGSQKQTEDEVEKVEDLWGEEVVTDIDIDKGFETPLILR